MTRIMKALKNPGIRQKNKFSGTHSMPWCMMGLDVFCQKPDIHGPKIALFSRNKLSFSLCALLSVQQKPSNNSLLSNQHAGKTSIRSVHSDNAYKCWSVYSGRGSLPVRIQCLSGSDPCINIPCVDQEICSFFFCSTRWLNKKKYVCTELYAASSYSTGLTCWARDLIFLCSTNTFRYFLHSQPVTGQ